MGVQVKQGKGHPPDIQTGWSASVCDQAKSNLAIVVNLFLKEKIMFQPAGMKIVINGGKILL